MKSSTQPSERLAEMVRGKNRALAVDAALKTGLGILFTLLIFGMFYWGAWFVGFLFAHYLGLHPWQFGAIFTGLFLAVAVWSAWRRVDPLAGLKPLSDEELLLTLISHAAPGVVYFSPRHASAGFAVILIGGPAGVIEAFGIWTHRLRADAETLEQAARMLALCADEMPAKKIASPAAALLLKRLALIKATPRDDSHVLTVTEAGRRILGVKRERQ